MTHSAEKDAPQYVVGQRVWLYDVNDRANRGPESVVVTKVGRKLVTIEGKYGYTATHRIETGRKNDDYGHTWIKTDDERAADDRREAAVKRMHAHGLRFDYGARRHSTEAIEAICDLLDTRVSPPVVTEADQ